MSPLSLAYARQLPHRGASESCEQTEGDCANKAIEILRTATSNQAFPFRRRGRGSHCSAMGDEDGKTRRSRISHCRRQYIAISRSEIISHLPKANISLRASALSALRSQPLPPPGTLFSHRDYIFSPAVPLGWVGLAWGSRGEGHRALGFRAHGEGARYRESL